MLTFDRKPTRNSQTPRVVGLVAVFGVLVVAANALIGTFF